MTASSQMQFIRVPKNTPLIVNNLAGAQLTYESYKLVYYADLKPFFAIRDNIQVAIDSVKVSHTCLNKPIYISAAGQLQHQLELLYADEERLMAHRAKRFILCETCGKVNHFLFGVLDQRDAKRYNEAINNLTQATLLDKELIRNQSKVFEAALHFNKNVFLRYEKEINDLNTKTENLTQEFKQIQLEVTEQSLIQITQLLFSEYYRIYGQIRRTLSDALNGKINELIPKKQLSKDLELVSKLLLPSQKLPIDYDNEDIFHIFKFSTIKSTLFARKILVEITIPIAEKEQYNLFKATPIPMQVGSMEMIVSVHSKFFLLNWDKTKYIPMSNQQLDNGKMLANGDMLYRPTVTTLLNSDEICEWQILLEGTKSQTACHVVPFLERNIIMTITENEMLFVSLDQNTTIYETCNNTQFDQRKIQGRGTIILDPNCSFKTENFSIRPHKTNGMNETQVILPIVKFNENLIKWNIDALEKVSAIKRNGKKLNVIQNAVELQLIMDSTKKLVENADHEWKMEEMKNESGSISFMAGLIGSFSILVSVMTIGGLIFYKCNVFNCLLRAIIGKSTAAQVEPDGSLILDLPQVLAPKLKNTGRTQLREGQTLHQQLNETSIEIAN